MVCTSTPEKSPGYSFSLQPSQVHVVFLDLPRDVIRSVARFRLRVHTLRFETATCNPISSPTPTCDLCEADDDVQDEQHAIFHCTHTYTVSLRRRYESLFSEARAQDVFTFLHQNNNTLF